MTLGYLWLVPIGFAVGAYGTLIGAGGGFVLVPVLLWLYPHESPEVITSISLAVVFFNSLSGSAAYARMRRIDYKSGLLFSAATVPGAILGALVVSYIPRDAFDVIFGIMMIGASAFLLIRPRKDQASRKECNNKRHVLRTLIDSNGDKHVFSYNPAVGVILSLFVGFISSLLGIGGGIVHVPILVHLLDFPVHFATATSHFILVVMTFAGTVTHVVQGEFAHGLWRTVALAVGVMPGAQLGAKLSSRCHGDWIIRGLAVALGLVGIRLLILAL
jgi:uncharacterized membrane protein YfcA